MANQQHDLLRQQIERTGRVPLRVQPRNRYISPLMERAMKNPRQTRNFALGLIAGAPVRIPGMLTKAMNTAMVPSAMMRADLLRAGSVATAGKFPRASQFLLGRAGKHAKQARQFMKQSFMKKPARASTR
jgi:hypothetical protein